MAKRNCDTSVKARLVDALGQQKRHNWTTNQKDVDSQVSQDQMFRVCSCNHLTPAAEAQMDNLIASDDETVARFTDAVVTKNLPTADEVEKVPASWDAGPSKQALDAIEKGEESRATC